MGPKINSGKKIIPYFLFCKQSNQFYIGTDKDFLLQQTLFVSKFLFVNLAPNHLFIFYGWKTRKMTRWLGMRIGPASGNAIENLGETKIRPFAPALPRKCKYFAQNTTKTICQILHNPKYCRSHHISSQIFVSTIVYIVIQKMYFNYWQESLTIIIRLSNFENRSNTGEYLPPQQCSSSSITMNI